METTIKNLSLIIILAPLIAASCVGLLNKTISRTLAHTICIVAISISTLLASILFYFFISNDSPSYSVDSPLYIWGNSGHFNFQLGVLIDRLTAVMIFTVTVVSLMVHIYTVGYMHDDPGYQRFFSYLSLFTFAMLVLVMSNNFLQLFFGWEMVGLMSYLLIGFWFKKENAIKASFKAFIVNRVGDFGFILGIAAVAYYFKSLNFAIVFQNVEMLSYSSVSMDIFKNMNGVSLAIFSSFTIPAITLICLLLFVGAMGKSAQIPLHVWLPDSMEGPTPISALIHAATMVTAGVFMIARLSPLYEYSETALNVITMVGSLTALLMGLVGIVQNDIKRIIAYSTLSQLGYMMVAMGVSAYSVGIFHLFTHAFFKALLFLAAGSVIIALHHEQNIWKMGNLKKFLPITYATMLIGCLALIGFPFFSGYYSKDLIIEAVHHSELTSASFAYCIVQIGVLITALYTFRLFFVVFHTQERFGQIATKNNQIIQNNRIDHLSIHESPKVVLFPLLLLAIPSIIAGSLFITPIVNDFFGSALLVLPEHDTLKKFKDEYANPIIFGLKGFVEASFWLALTGMVITFIVYQKYPKIPLIIQNKLNIIYKMLTDQWGFDDLYENKIVPAITRLARVFWILGDRTVIDGAAVNGSAQTVDKMAGIIGKFQTGYLYHYTFVMLSGFLIIILALWWGY